MALLGNHIAVVTGAGSGIGRAIASGYAREGARVVLLDVNGKAAAEAAQEIRTSGGKAESFALDVTKREDCVAVAKQVADKVGQVSILVNNAGIARRNGMLGAAEAVIKDWEDIIAINLTGVFNVTHAFLEPLRAAKGRIVNIGSIQSFVHLRTPSSPAYTASKHGVLGFTTRARRRTRQGRRARQCDRPGLHRNAAEREGARQQSGAGEDLHRPHPARPRRKPEDIVGPAIFLASDLSAYVTGSIVMARRRAIRTILSSHVQRPAFRHRRPCVLGRSLSGLSRRMRKEAPIAFVPQLGSTVFTRRDDIFTQEKRIDVFSSHQPAGLMNTLMGHNMMRKDGDAHMSERAAMFPCGVAAHGARHLEPAVPGPCRPHPRAAGAAPAAPISARRSRCRCRPNA